MADERTFTATRSKAVFLVLGCIAFVVGGYFIRAEKPLIAWACMIFFGLGIPLGFAQLFWPNSSYLRLDAEGFEIGSLVGKKRVKWYFSKVPPLARLTATAWPVPADGQRTGIRDRWIASGRSRRYGCCKSDHDTASR